MKQSIAKTLFIINPHSIIDVITNSSSELFVFEGKKKIIIEEMIESIYPDYLTEYEELVKLSSLNNEEFKTYLDWVYDDWNNKLFLSEKFNIKPEILYSNFNEYSDKYSDKYWYGKISDEGLKLIKDQLDVENTYLLYSIDENPNFEMQEELKCIGKRYHLG